METKQATSDKTSEESKQLEPCPFCGGVAEMYTGRTFTRRGGLCGSQIEALKKLNEFRKMGTVVAHYIGTRNVYRANMKEKALKWTVHVEMQGYIPRCSNTNCMGRTQIMFQTEAEAAEAWNRRAVYAD